MEELMLVPLFSYDTNSKELDVSCFGGDICYVMSVTTTANDHDIELNKAMVNQMIGSGKKIIDAANLSVEELRELMSFIDVLAQNKKQWNYVYNILEAEFQKQKNI